MHQRLFHRARHIVRAVEDGHIPQRHAAIMQPLHLARHPLRLRLLRVGKVADDLLARGLRREQVLFDAVAVFCDQRVRRRQNLRRGTVVFHHHDGLHIWKNLVEIQQILDVRAAPGVDRLVRVAHDEEVAVIAAQHLHQLILQRVDVGIIQHQKALRVLHGVAVLLQNGDTEAVERVDIARVVVAGQGVDTLAHLVG